MAIGPFAMNTLNAGFYNVGVGMFALGGITPTPATYNYMTAVGYGAGVSYNTTGSSFGNIYSVFVGYSVGNNSSGSYNCMVGGRQNGQSSTGSYNTFIGSNSQVLGLTYSGSKNTVLGGGTATTLTVTGSNNTLLGSDAVLPTAATANTIQLGSAAIAFLRCQVGLTTVSDARDKKDFVPLDAGLDFVNELKPVRFEWNTRDGGLEGRKDVGFTAQSLQETQEKTGLEIPQLVNDENPDKLSIMPTQLIPVLVKAVQELSAEVKMLKELLASK
jgi:hypothetical protein